MPSVCVGREMHSFVLLILTHKRVFLLSLHGTFYYFQLCVRVCVYVCEYGMETITELWTR